MALQRPPLTLTGIGVKEDTPPDQYQPRLPDGIHLRWNFDRSLGFPWFGSYLFRRTHWVPRLSDYESVGIGNLPAWQTGDHTSIGLNGGNLQSEMPLMLATENGKTVVLSGNSEWIEFEWQAHRTTRAVLLDFHFPVREIVEITLYFAGNILKTQKLDGSAGQNRTIDFQEDAIDKVRIKADTTFLEEIKFVLVSNNINEGWEPIRGVPLPLTLPLSHPQYPASNQRSVVKKAREIAEARIHYGDPREILTHSELLDKAGTISVNSGGWRVTGNGTHWKEAYRGEVIFIEEDAFTIQQVVSPTQLILSRPFLNKSLERKDYEIKSDHFAKFHDYLAFLVQKGPGSGSMADLTLPVSLEARGQIQISPFNTMITGTQTDWSSDLEGLMLIPDNPEGEDILTPRKIIQVIPPNILIIDSAFEIDETVEREYHVEVVPVADAQGQTLGSNIEENPFDLLQLVSLQPAYAQMLGVYWLDESAEANERYDYLIIADFKGDFSRDYAEKAGRDPSGFLKDFLSSGFDAAELYATFGQLLGEAPKVDVPQEVRCFSLPAFRSPPSTGIPRVVKHSAGVNWDTQFASPKGSKNRNLRNVLYHIWRSELSREPTGSIKANLYDLQTEEQPFLVPDYDTQGYLAPAGFPPFPLAYMDGGLAPGWYSYQVTGIDIFGRHSERSLAAAWHYWQPAPTILPWYFPETLSSNTELNEYAVQMADPIPPPMPDSVRAFALDDKDPALVKDVPYQQWRTALEASGWFKGMSKKEQQDLVGLRVKWHWTAQHRLLAPDLREFRVYFKIDQFDAVQGRIIGINHGDTPFRSWVTVDILGGNRWSVDQFKGARLQFDGHTFPVLKVTEGPSLILELENIGPGGIIPPTSGAKFKLLPNSGHFSQWEQRYFVQPGNLGYTQIDNQVHEYEVFLPHPDGSFKNGLPLYPSAEKPMIYGQVGVAAADTQDFDDQKIWNETGRGGFGNRKGLESVISGPAAIYRVKTTPPDPPVFDFYDSNNIYATKADYFERSFWEFRWPPLEHHSLLLYRSLDNSLFQVDWERRETAAVLAASDSGFFPKDWDAPKRGDIAQKLNVLNSFERTSEGKKEANAYFDTLENDALRVLGGLPGNDEAFSRITPEPISSGEKDFEDLRSFQDTLPGKAINRYFYRASYTDGAHNESVLSLSTPPIYLPDIIPPKAPVLVRIKGGEGKLLLCWTPNREPDMQEYRVYATYDKGAAEDLRLMEQIGTIQEVIPDPIFRGSTRELLEENLIAGKNRYYRVVAVDIEGNISRPSKALTARIADDRIPYPPYFLDSGWQAQPKEEEPFIDLENHSLEKLEAVAVRIRLEWGSNVPGARFTLSRKTEDQPFWQPLLTKVEVPPIIEETYEFFDNEVDPEQVYHYRIRVFNGVGLASTNTREIRIDTPKK